MPRKRYYDITIRCTLEEITKIRIVAAVNGMAAPVWARSYVLFKAEEFAEKNGLALPEPTSEDCPKCAGTGSFFVATGRRKRALRCHCTGLENTRSDNAEDLQ